MNVNQWSFVLYDLLYLEIDNLIESREPSKETLRSTKSLLPQDDTTSLDAEEIQQRKLVKKKKKAKFELPNPNLVK
jgi:hypothetical protein